MKLTTLIKGLTNYNHKGQLESSSLPWFNHSDFKAFLMRCYHNSIPIYGVDIYQLKRGVAHHVQTLLARDAQYHREGLYYRRWNRHLIDHQLEMEMPAIRTKAQAFRVTTTVSSELFPVRPIIQGTLYLDTHAELDELCFVPAGDWESV